MTIEHGPKRGMMLVISSPSGAGKTSLSRRFLADHPELSLSVSCTTRAPRPGEQEGREYRFVDRARFDAMIEADGFLEWAEVHENRYGSPRAPVEAFLAQAIDVPGSGFVFAQRGLSVMPDDLIPVRQVAKMLVHPAKGCLLVLVHLLTSRIIAPF